MEINCIEAPELQEARAVLGYPDHSWQAGSITGAKLTFDTVGRAGRSRLLMPRDRRLARSVWRGFTTSRVRGDFDSEVRWWLARQVSRGVSGTTLSLVAPRQHTSQSEHDTLHRFLAGVFGAPNIELGMRLSNGRPNAKPVVAVVDPSGEILGFAKFGINPLTARLVQHEAKVLSSLSSLALPVDVPGVAFAGEWAQMQVLVTASTRSRRLVGRVQRPLRLAEELAQSAPGGEQALAETDFWLDLQGRAQGRAGHSGTELALLVSQLEERWGDVLVHLGLGHGDWHRANLGENDRGVTAHDWERCRSSQPQGLDGAHFLLFEGRRGGVSASRHAATVGKRAERELCRLGYTPREAQMLLAVAIAELAIRVDEGMRLGLTSRANRFLTLLQHILKKGRRSE